jgi:hypothetical protein
VGIDRELLPNFAVGLAYTWRQSRDLQWGGNQGGRPRVNVTTADYIALPPVTAGGFTAVGYDASAAASLFGRQGFPFIQVIRTQGPNEGFKNIIVQDAVEKERYPDICNLDLRLAKALKIAGSSSININLDLFNAFNNNVDLVRQRTFNTSVYNRIDEILSPRILRIGATFPF